MNGAAETKMKFAANAAVKTLTAIAAAVAPVLRIPFLVFIGTPKSVRLTCPPPEGVHLILQPYYSVVVAFFFVFVLSVAISFVL